MNPWAQPRVWVTFTVIAAAFSVTVLVLLRGGISSEATGMVIGAWLTGGLSTAVTYWLGSSKGSEETTRQLDASKRETVREIEAENEGTRKSHEHP